MPKGRGTGGKGKAKGAPSVQEKASGKTKSDYKYVESSGGSSGDENIWWPEGDSTKQTVPPATEATGTPKKLPAGKTFSNFAYVESDETCSVESSAEEGHKEGPVVDGTKATVFVRNILTLPPPAEADQGSSDYQPFATPSTGPCTRSRAREGPVPDTSERLPPKPKKRRSARAFSSIPEIMGNQEDLARWVEANDLLYNRANKFHTDKRRQNAVYAAKADEIRGITEELCGKLSLFY